MIEISNMMNQTILVIILITINNNGLYKYTIVGVSRILIQGEGAYKIV
jgi:hypothetical protein